MDGDWMNMEEFLKENGCKTVDEFIIKSVEQNEKEAELYEQQKKKEKVEAILLKSGISKRFQKRTFKTFERNKDNEIAYQDVAKFAREFPKDQGLLLIGPIGTGKTHLAAAVANHLISKMHAVYFGSITNIIELVKSSFNRDSNITEAEIIKTLTKDVELLIIDDLGKEQSTEYVNTLLYHIVNELYENEKAIICTTNFKASKLANKLGERGGAIISRLTEMTTPVVLNGKDWRLK